MTTVSLQPVDEKTLPKLLDAAVADTDPGETMPPVPGPPGWTEERREAFRAYHRPGRETTYAIVAADEIIGAARLAPAESPGTVEAGLWLCRSARGKGYGTEALRLLIDEARTRGATALIAETTMSNTAAVGALRHLGAKLWEDTENGTVHATLRVGEFVADGN